MQISKKLERILMNVQKPAQYMGGEVNAVIKDPAKVDVRFGFCFPDTYEVGMSHLGMKILYGVLNEMENVYCERFFAPWIDMEEKMRENEIPLFSLETHDSAADFDILGFTLQYEMSYTNIVNMLDLAGVPPLAADRSEDDPIVCAGGPCAYNAEPLADFVDFFMMGEGEDIICQVTAMYAENRKRGGTKKEYLKEIAKLEGIYVPAFYDVVYNDDWTIKSVTPNEPEAKKSVRKIIIDNLDETYYPTKYIVPYIDIVHDRAVLELFRGCTRGCRFCQAGMIYRPVRERSADKLLQQAKELIDNTGYEEISLTSLSTSDYTELEKLCNGLIDMTEPKKINIALPSLRIDNFSMELMHKIQKVRKSGLTFAPEAGTQRLRDVINKNITQDDVVASSKIAFEGGYNGVKLYFMMGLPTETEEDIKGIAALATVVADQYFAIPKENRAKGLAITVSTSCFVPKPFTPFQWEPQEDIPSLEAKQDILKAEIKQRFIKYSWHDAHLSYLEGVFARGDRRLGKVLLEAQKAGCKFDSWNETFSFEKWMDVFERCGIDHRFYTTRKREYDEVFPWDHIDVGVSKKFLMHENQKAHQGITTPQCREKCSGCGAGVFGGVICAG